MFAALHYKCLKINFTANTCMLYLYMIVKIISGKLNPYGITYIVLNSLVGVKLCCIYS